MQYDGLNQTKMLELNKSLPAGKIATLTRRKHGDTTHSRYRVWIEEERPAAAIEPEDETPIWWEPKSVWDTRGSDNLPIPCYRCGDDLTAGYRRKVPSLGWKTLCLQCNHDRLNKVAWNA